MLGASALVLGGTLGFAQFRDQMIKQYFATMPKPVIPVSVDMAHEDAWTQELKAVGTLKAVNGVDVTVGTAGLVKEILFQSGDQVTKGQVLVRLDTDVERADLASASAERSLAATQEARSRTLAQAGHVAQSALDKSQAELKVKDAKMAQLAALIARKTVTAPFAGVLGVRKIDVGQYLQPGQSVATLQDLSVLRLEIPVSQKDLAGLEQGLRVEVEVDAWAGRVFEGVISAIDPEVDVSSGMVAMEARIPNPDGALKPGMFAQVRIGRQDIKSVLVVPVTAVTYSLSGDSVFVVEPSVDGDKAVMAAKRVPIKVGERRDGWAAVTGDLKPGDKVVTSGQLKLESGTLVSITEGSPFAPAPQPAQANAAKP
ncbi:MAG: efflux RND transporter periplasmic adaptor subunit [Alphaproteobacteria bacterium]|nr:efflux RND transporter periplasmic adaptor subunit [Alphaproteobacteria bacterium]